MTCKQLIDWERFFAEEAEEFDQQAGPPEPGDAPKWIPPDQWMTPATMIDDLRMAKAIVAAKHGKGSKINDRSVGQDGETPEGIPPGQGVGK